MNLAACSLAALLACPAPSGSPGVVNPPAPSAAVLLYAEDAVGNKKFRCTATCIKGSGFFTKARYLTAGHCVLVDDPKKPGALRLTDELLFLSPDQLSDEHRYIRARAVRYGNPDKGLDYAVLESSLDAPFFPLGSEKGLPAGTPVTLWNGEAGLGISEIRGWIAKPFVNRAIANAEEHVNWFGTIMVQAPIVGGASGSALVVDGKVVGIVVSGGYGLGLAVPISRVVADLENPEKETARGEPGR